MDESSIHERILDCRYYGGEDRAPEGINEMFWGYECGWANHMHQDNWDCEKQSLKRLGLENFEPDDGTPYSLKCLLFNRYCHWIGIYDKGQSFLKWYREQYQSPRKTNRQRRYESRKEQLIKRCRFYKGEEECPFENEKDSHFWLYESIWVDKLSQSYTYADKFRNELLPYNNIRAFAKEHGLPSSFIGLLVNRDIHWLGSLYEQGFITSLRRDYLKIDYSPAKEQ